MGVFMALGRALENYTCINLSKAGNGKNSCFFNFRAVPPPNPPAKGCTPGPARGCAPRPCRSLLSARFARCAVDASHNGSPSVGIQKLGNRGILPFCEVSFKLAWCVRYESVFAGQQIFQLKFSKTFLPFKISSAIFCEICSNFGVYMGSK